MPEAPDRWAVIQGDCLSVMGGMEAGSVQCCVTSPPYWGLRDYGTATWEGGDEDCDHFKLAGGTGAQNLGKSAKASAANVERSSVPFREVCGKCGAHRVDGQLGLERTPEEYVGRMVEVFREVRRVLREDGTVFLNLGDSYSADKGQGKPSGPVAERRGNYYGGEHGEEMPDRSGWRESAWHLKPKDLVGIPWRVAFALQADGWWLRSDIIWAKPNPMPESVTDRPTKSHEYVFLLTKSARYYWDQEAAKEAAVDPESYEGRRKRNDKGINPEEPGFLRTRGGLQKLDGQTYSTRNLRTVWTIATEPFPGAHFATFPTKLVEPCIRAGTSVRGCCPECGAGWERVVEHHRRSAPGDLCPKHSQSAVTGLRQPGWRKAEVPNAFSSTLGWRPGCECRVPEDSAPGSGPVPYPPVPCLVLDPFAGAGTVGLVALRLGRRFVGIELNPAYCDMARTRIAEAEAPSSTVQDDDGETRTVRQGRLWDDGGGGAGGADLK